MKSITVELENEIDYSFKGGIQKGGFLEISEPNGKIASLVGSLKAQIGAATKDAIKGLENLSIDSVETSDEEDAPESTGEAVFSMLMMGGGDMAIVMSCFCDILKESGKVAGEGNFTKPIFDKMAYSDIEKALKAYIGNFIQAS